VKNGKSPGPFGWVAEHLKPIVSDTTGKLLGAATSICDSLAVMSNHIRTKQPELYEQLAPASTLILLNKTDVPNEDVRPIQAPELFGKLFAKVEARKARDYVTRLLEPLQLGQSQRGTETIVKTIQLLFEDSQDLFFGQVDFQNAFNELCRKLIRGSCQ
jgi:hypothetical protein